MNKLYALLTAALSICSSGYANTANVISTSTTLNGSYAYKYLVNVGSLGTGNSIISASISWNNVTLTDSPIGTGVLYTDLLNAHGSSSSALDNDAAGDYWATKYSGNNITSLGKQTFSSIGTTLAWTYVFSTSQIAALNTYLASNGGQFDIGVDPDCNYNVVKTSICGLTFTYTIGQTSAPSVPDGAESAVLVVTGLAAVELFRRKFATGH